MEKYFFTILNSIKKSLVYRVDSFIRIVSSFLSFVVIFFFWNSIYRQGNVIGGYSLKAIITYYVLVFAFEILILNMEVPWGIGEEIKNGKIVGTILMPINYLNFKLSQTIGSFLYRAAVFIPAIGLAIFVLRDHLVGGVGFSSLIILILGSMLSLVLYFLFYFIVMIISFWTQDYYGLFWISFVTIGFMQGTMVPLDLLPSWFVKLANFLPFEYMFFVPVSAFSGRIVFNWSLLLVPIIWCVILYFVGQFMFIKGVKRYESYGI